MNNENNVESVLYAVGTRGYSAYEVAVQNGFVGTEQEWLDSLVGPTGALGPEGKSAYEIAVENGYIGTEEEWVNDFLTPDGYYNKSTVDTKLSKKININDIIDNLTSSTNDKPLSANQGRVLKTLVDDNEENINSLNTTVANTYATKTEVNTSVSNLNSQISSLSSGSPLKASSISEMTDTTRIYVNTSNGYWYYYDGSDWQSGGVYQATENSSLLSDIADNVTLTQNLYRKNDVELNVTSSGTTYQRYTLNNPIPDHYYACFSLNLNRNYKGMLIVQYNNNTLISQYRGNQYQDHPVDANCTKIVFMNTNSSETTPYDLMILDMTNKTLDDVTEFIDEYDTLKDTTHLNNIDPSSLKGSIPYNLYNHEKNIYFDGTYQRSDFYNIAGKKFGLYCYNDGLKRLTGSNNNGKYAIVTTYDSSHATLDTYSNPSSDITLSNDAYVMEVAIVNNTTEAYTNIMIIDKDTYSDTDVNSIGFLPYSYFLNTPYYLRNVITEEDIPDLRPYSGKNMLSLGDSFTYLNYYGEKLASITGCTQTPHGVNGGNIGAFVGNKYTPTGGGGTLVTQTFDAELLAPYDIVTVMGGTNNYGRAMPLGTINDSPSVNNTVYGEIKYVIDKILTLKPSIKIIWCTEPYRIDSTSVAPGGYLPNDAGYTMEDVADAIINVCNHYGIPVFDFYRNSGWNSYTVKYNNLGALVENIYTYDGLHPKSGSGNGGELLGISFGNFINSI